MPKYQFSLILDGVEHTKEVKIDKSELSPKSLAYLPFEFQVLYRESVIKRHLQAWAMSKLNLTYREVTQNEQRSGHDQGIRGKGNTSEAQSG